MVGVTIACDDYGQIPLPVAIGQNRGRNGCNYGHVVNIINKCTCNEYREAWSRFETEPTSLGLHSRFGMTSER